MSTAQFQEDIDVWGMETTSGGGGDFELCPAKNHPGIIVAVIDLGTHREQVTQREKVPGFDEEVEVLKDKDLRKIALVYELAAKQTNGQPFVMGEEFTWSMNTKAKFYDRVCNITGHTFNDGEAFDPRGILGMPVMVNVAHKPHTKDGKTKTYANVKTVAQYPDGIPAPQATLDAFIYSPRSGQPFQDREWLPRLYGREIKTMIENCIEVRGRQVSGTDRANGFTSPPPPKQDANGIPTDEHGNPLF